MICIQQITSIPLIPDHYIHPNHYMYVLCHKIQETGRLMLPKGLYLLYNIRFKKQGGLCFRRAYICSMSQDPRNREAYASKGPIFALCHKIQETGRHMLPKGLYLLYVTKSKKQGGLCFQKSTFLPY